jgi:hypothetical protein
MRFPAAQAGTDAAAEAGESFVTSEVLYRLELCRRAATSLALPPSPGFGGAVGIHGAPGAGSPLFGKDRPALVIAPAATYFQIAR